MAWLSSYALAQCYAMKHRKYGPFPMRKVGDSRMAFYEYDVTRYMTTREDVMEFLSAFVEDGGTKDEIEFFIDAAKLALDRIIEAEKAR